MPDTPVGPVVTPPPGRRPDGRTLYGRWCTVMKADAARDALPLWRAIDNEAGRTQEHWAYMPYGPFESLESFTQWLTNACESADPLFHVIMPKSTGEATGMASLMRIDPANGVIEIGHIWLSPGLQRTREATEGLFLLMAHAMETLANRRLEWKCNALNAPSRRAADRFGFTYEGTFRQHLIVKGRNRDSAWYSILDKEWPTIAAGFRTWLDPANFDEQGNQKAPLATSG